MVIICSSDISGNIYICGLGGTTLSDLVRALSYGARALSKLATRKFSNSTPGYDTA